MPNLQYMESSETYVYMFDNGRYFAIPDEYNDFVRDNFEALKPRRLTNDNFVEICGFRFRSRANSNDIEHLEYLFIEVARGNTPIDWMDEVPVHEERSEEYICEMLVDEEGEHYSVDYFYKLTDFIAPNGRKVHLGMFFDIMGKPYQVKEIHLYPANLTLENDGHEFCFYINDLWFLGFRFDYRAEPILEDDIPSSEDARPVSCDGANIIDVGDVGIGLYQGEGLTFNIEEAIRHIVEDGAIAETIRAQVDSAIADIPTCSHRD